MPDTFTNWAGNVTFGTAKPHRPTSVQQLQDIVARSRFVRALGTGHSFNRIADVHAGADVHPGSSASAGTGRGADPQRGGLVSVAGLPKVVEVDRDAATATVSAGLRYGEVGARLHAAGFALRNLGSLPHISVAGACATGTHGSGESNGSLASAVRGIEIVTADGELVRWDRDADSDVFPGAVVALGCLGVATQLTLDIVPAYDVRQYVYDDMPYRQLLGNLDEVLGAAYSVSLFTDWRGDDVNQVWLKHRVESTGTPPAETHWLGATLADGPRHPLRGMPAENCTQQLGVPGPWHERLPHFRLEFVPSNGDELQSEYLLPREYARAAFEAVHAIAGLIAPVLLISEIRTVAADNLWLSTAYGHATIAFHFTWANDEAAVFPVLAAIEEQLAPFRARPHWGKLFSTEPSTVRELYDHAADFEKISQRLDPQGKFRNAFANRYFPNRYFPRP